MNTLEYVTVIVWSFTIATVWLIPEIVDMLNELGKDWESNH